MASLRPRLSQTKSKVAVSEPKHAASRFKRGGKAARGRLSQAWPSSV